tara:strand:- start:12087 stop:12278 length:192 start_codon:yes stop_codon:yes gene_type:complete
MKNTEQYANYLYKISALLKDIDSYKSEKIDKQKIKLLKGLLDSTSALIKLLEHKEKTEPKALA